jgi:hypothetical protein
MKVTLLLQMTLNLVKRKRTEKFKIKIKKQKPMQANKHNGK